MGSGPIGERTVPLIEYGALAMFFLCVCLFGGEVVVFFCFLFFVFFCTDYKLWKNVHTWSWQICSLDGSESRWPKQLL